MAEFSWTRLPRDLRYGLLCSAGGKPGLTSLARTALAKPETAGLGLDLLLAAWEASPLDGGLASTLLDLDARTGFLPPATRNLLQALTACWTAPDDAGTLAALAARRDHSGLVSWLSARGDAQPGNLFWRQHLLDACFLLADWERAEATVRLPWPEGLDPVRARIAADIRAQTGRPEEACGLYARALVLRPAVSRLAWCLHRLGDRDGAVRAWRAAHALAPWNVSPVLRLHDHLSGLDRPGPLPPGRIAVCLYTCGKARAVDATLAALAASDLGGARLLALDNASPDDTPAVLAAWRDRLGGRLEVIGLPVNVGAPAARNWLKHHEAVAGSDWVAYLDDDALVPPDWLGLLAQAARAYPEAGAWGCRVTDLAAPGRVQTVDIHLLDPFPDGAPRFASPCTEDLDFGQFEYARPCLSVTGCCHLFRTSQLVETGDFDIRLSPTQYDDLDHDLRAALAGNPAVYQGHLRVLHARLSGALLNLDRAATGVSQGNLRKLAGKYSPEQQQALLRQDDARMLADLRAKLQVVEAAG